MRQLDAKSGASGHFCTKKVGTLDLEVFFFAVILPGKLVCEAIIYHYNVVPPSYKLVYEPQ